MPIAARRGDVLFSPAYTIPLAFRGPCVVTIHGGFDRAVMRSFPPYFRLRHLPFYRYAAMHADAIVMLCHAARAELLDSMAEQTIGAAMLRETATAETLSAAILRIIGDPALRNELRAKELARARMYSWERCARETMRVLAAAARGERVSGLAEAAP